MANRIRREMTVPADTTYLAKVRSSVLEVLKQTSLPPVKANMVALAVDEAVANIMEHAYADNRPPDAPHDTDIRIVLDSDARRFEVLIRDRGAAFDPSQAPEVDMTEHVKAGKKGGLGIFLIRRIMDEINYTYKQGHHNELQMIKYLDAPPAPSAQPASGTPPTTGTPGSKAG